MKILLDVKDEKAHLLLEFLRELSFVNQITILTENDKEPSKKEILAAISQGMKEAELHKQGKLKLRSARQLLDEL
ncbi:hypothetical protein [Leptospira mayottensis]|uniref:hypothetical protein n=1 Tax=Leptospira mayottensis TaxID=1137606 RepID=UPI000E35C34B|nr:hypothetical protein [Leptospira mayottensis]AXR66854.1 hypothetical protein DPV73_01225 [Leptospira mayottensis]AXR66872.1 hypothetical protein DPV73_01340 [Leptospira mayottensis]